MKPITQITVISKKNYDAEDFTIFGVERDDGGREHYALARIDDCPEHDDVAPEDVYDYIHNALTYWNARGAVQAIRMQDTDVLSIIRRKK